MKAFHVSDDPRSVTRPVRRDLFAGVPLLLLLALLGTGCAKHDPASGMTSYSADSRAGNSLLTLRDDQLARIRVVQAAKSRLRRELRLTGSVTYNGFRTTPVITQVGGPVTRILVTPGQKVKAGQPLLYVNSPDYSQLRATYLKARTAFSQTDKNYARAQDLYTHRAIAERDLLQAETDRNQARADLEASEQALRILGIKIPTDSSASPSLEDIPVLAAVDGEVIERLVAPGQVLQAGTTQCFTLTDMSTVWVLVNIYESQLSLVSVGDAVSIQSDAYPDVFRGKISYLAPALDPATRTLQARIETANPGERLRKDMYVVATVQAGHAEDALVVPDSAVMRDSENIPYVYVAQGPSQFGRRLVTVGESHDGHTHVIKGLQLGERVVGDGSLFLQFINALQ